MNALKAWSCSKYSLYKQCPLKFKLIALDKCKEPPSPALARGREIHDQIEAYLKGHGVLPESCTEHFRIEFENIKAIFSKTLNGALAEEEWAFTKEWQPTHWRDWSSAWLRSKVDCLYTKDQNTLLLFDWKTGKFSPKYSLQAYLEQLELYSLIGLLMVEHAIKVIPQLIFVDAGVVYPGDQAAPLYYYRKDIEELKNRWQKRIAPMFEDMEFKPKASALCQFCHFRKSNNGICPLNK